MALSQKEISKLGVTARNKGRLQKDIEQAESYDWESIPDSERAWAAGFFDGEGWTTITFDKRRNKGQMAMGVKQNDRELLDRFQRAVGWGSICGPYKHHIGENSHYRWQLYGENKICDVLTKIGPYLGNVKMKQALLALEKGSEQ